MRELTKKEQRTVNLALAGGSDKELVVLHAVDELETKFDEKTTEIQQSFKDTVQEIKDNAPDLKEVLKSVRGNDGHTPTNEELTALIEPLIPTPEDGKTPTETELLALIKPLIPKVENGKTPTDEELKTLIKPLIPEVENGKDADETTIVAKIEADLPTLGAAIRDALELLQGDERLDAKYIKGLEEALKILDDKISNLPKGVAARASNSTRFTDLSAQTNGSLKVFSVPKGLAGVLFSSDFPQVLMENNGFTLNASRTQLTMTTDNAPSTSSQLLYQSINIFN